MRKYIVEFVKNIPKSKTKKLGLNTITIGDRYILREDGELSYIYFCEGEVFVKKNDYKIIEEWILED